MLKPIRPLQAFKVRSGRYLYDDGSGRRCGVHRLSFVIIEYQRWYILAIDDLLLAVLLLLKLLDLLAVLGSHFLQKLYIFQCSFHLFSGSQITLVCTRIAGLDRIQAGQDDILLEQLDAVELII